MAVKPSDQRDQRERNFLDPWRRFLSLSFFQQMRTEQGDERSPTQATNAIERLTPGKLLFAHSFYLGTPLLSTPTKNFNLFIFSNKHFQDNTIISDFQTLTHIATTTSFPFLCPLHRFLPMYECMVLNYEERENKINNYREYYHLRFPNPNPRHRHRHHLLLLPLPSTSLSSSNVGF